MYICGLIINSYNCQIKKYLSAPLLQEHTYISYVQLRTISFPFFFMLKKDRVGHKEEVAVMSVITKIFLLYLFRNVSVRIYPSSLEVNRGEDVVFQCRDEGLLRAQVWLFRCVCVNKIYVSVSSRTFMKL